MAAPRIVVVAAVARNGVIGDRNRLVWRLPGDLARFRALTTGRSVVMGRSTFDSIGAPLPDRRNVVLSRDMAFAPAGVHVARSWLDALAAARGDAFVIGGAIVYAIALPMADRIHLTEVECEPHGDALMPRFDRDLFHEISRERRDPGPGETCAYSFVDLERLAPSPFHARGSKA